MILCSSSLGNLSSNSGNLATYFIMSGSLNTQPASHRYRQILLISSCLEGGMPMILQLCSSFCSSRNYLMMQARTSSVSVLPLRTCDTLAKSLRFYLSFLIWGTESISSMRLAVLQFLRLGSTILLRNQEQVERQLWNRSTLESEIRNRSQQQVLSDSPSDIFMSFLQKEIASSFQMRTGPMMLLMYCRQAKPAIEKPIAEQPATFKLLLAMLKTLFIELNIYPHSHRTTIHSNNIAC